MMTKQKIEGYWYSEYSPEYPMPVKDVLSEEEAKEICKLIQKKEVEARIHRYKGLSKSRITEKYLGNIEYETEKWKWPGDFAPHYVLQHKVKPTDDFLNYIGFKQHKK